MLSQDAWRQVEESFHQVSDLPPGERPSFLDQLSQGMPEIAREVRSLLDELEQDPDLTDSAVLALTSDWIQETEAGGLVGRILGQYELVRLLGVGGMGEVYEARDTTLGRSVALKILPSGFSAVAGVGRFVAEARMASAIQHPNVATIHEMREVDGTPFIAMEFVEGRTLAEVIREEGALAPERVARMACQILAGLGAAHARNIVHRDIKPSNLMVSAGDQVKVLDFGVAILFDEARAEEPVAGTLAYMSPEQLRGENVDSRSDLFSLGTVLHEMLTGVSPFRRATPRETQAAILSGGAPSLSLERNIPGWLRALVARCLEHRREDRYPSAEAVLAVFDRHEAGAHQTGRYKGEPDAPHLLQFGDFQLDVSERWLLEGDRPVPLPTKAFDVLTLLVQNHGRVVEKEELLRRIGDQGSDLTECISALRAALGSSAGLIETVPNKGYRFTAHVREGVTGGAALAVRSRRTRIVLGSAAVGALALVAAVVMIGPWKFGKSGEPVVNILPFTSYPGTEELPAISPDGRYVAFCWDGENETQIHVYVQMVGQDSPQRLTHSDLREYQPAWSPDGTQIAFFRAVSADQWELRKMSYPPAAGQAETLLATIAKEPNRFPGLSWSPDGKWLATAEPDNGSVGIVLISAESGEKRNFWTAGLPSLRSDPVYSPDGRYLAYVKTTDTAVEDLFLSRLPSGPEQQLTHDGAVITGITWKSDSASLVIGSERSRGRPTLWRIFLDGREPHRLTDSSSGSIEPSSARKSGRMAFSRRMDDINIWRVPADGSAAPAEWITSSALDTSPQYSPDGKSIAFRSNRTGSDEIWTAAADGTNPHRLTNFNNRVTGSPHWSPDGQWIAFDARATGNAEIYIVAAAGGVPRNLTNALSNEFVPTWSHDGKWIYFTSDRKGPFSLWRQAVAGGAPAQFVRPKGILAMESPDGRFLYYAHGPSEAGVFRAPTGGGAEEIVDPALDWAFWGGWTLADHSIYFVHRTMEANRSSTWLEAHDLITGKRRRICGIHQPVGFDSVMGVSPDGKWILFSQLDRSGSDIFLAEEAR